MNEFEVNFKKFLTNSERSVSGVIHMAFPEKIKEALKEPCLTNKTLHFYEMEHFQLLDFPNFGLSGVLVHVCKS